MMMGTHSVHSATFNVTNNANQGSGSLRDAVSKANASPGADEILIASNLGTIFVAGSQIDITETVTVKGPLIRSVISGQSDRRVFGFHNPNGGHNLTLENLNLIDTRTYGYGTLLISRPLDCTEIEGVGNGGAVCTNNNLTLINTTISNSHTTGTAATGGAIYARNATLINSTISNSRTFGNRAAGGAIYAQTTTLINSTISNNFTEGGYAPGGGISANTVNLNHSTVSGNKTDSQYSPGGGIYATIATITQNSNISENRTESSQSNGGGISASILTLSDSTITQNSATGYASSGGGIYAKNANIFNSAIQNNRTSKAYSNGGGLFVAQSLSLYNSTVSANNTAGQNASGGGIHSETATLTNSVLSANTTTGYGADGGGIRTKFANISNTTITNNRTSGTGANGAGINTSNSLTLTRSTVANNQTTGSNAKGGGMISTFLTMSNSTVSNNSTSGNNAPGGGISLYSKGTIRNTTISANSASGAGSSGGGIYHAADQNASLQLSSTILAGNSGVSASVDNFSFNAASNPTINLSFSLFGDPVTEINGLNNFNQFSNAASLNPLSDNGCSIKAGIIGHSACVQTHALQTNSLAINAGIHNGLLTDQRSTGFPRVINSLADIGAFESQALTPTTTGICGIDNKQTLTSTPSNLCTNGTASSISGSGPWNWSCFGSNGGSTASCSAQLPTYQITANTAPPGTGTASCLPDSVNHGTNSSCSVTTNNGFIFDSWSGDCTGNSCLLSNITSNKVVTANFDPINNGACGSDNGQTLINAPTNLCTDGTASAVSGSGPWNWTCSGQNTGSNDSCSANLQSYPITANANPVNGGSASCTPNQVDHGSNSSCSATSNTGFVLKQWTGDCSGLSCSLNTITSAKAVTANFDPIINGVCGTDNAQILNIPPTKLCVSGTASAVSGNGPWNWSCKGANTGTDASCASTIQTHPITANADPVAGGSASCTPNPVNNGADSSCAAITNTGYVFNNWSGDCIGDSCSLNTVTSPKTVTANFFPIIDGVCGADNAQTLTTTPVKLCTTGIASSVNGAGPWSWSCNGQNTGKNDNCAAELQQHPITVNSNPVAGGTASCTPNPVNHGSDSQCSATSNNGYVLEQWTGDCSGNNCSLDAVTNSKTVTANFAQIAHGACDSDNGKTLTSTPTNLCTNGTASAVSGNGPWNWTCTSTNGGDISNCAANLQTYSITTIINPAGAGTASCLPNPAKHGASSSCTATSASGFIFIDWSGDCTGNDCSLTAITSNKTVTANFALISNGVCGTDNGKTLTSTPTNLCTNASATEFIGTGPWSWNCAGQNSGISASCSADLQTYPISANANPPAGGSASCTPNPVKHNNNSNCAATVNSGYKFDRWSGDCTGTSCSLSSITSAKAVTANFLSIVDGNCGSDDGQTLTSTPTNLCTNSTASAMSGTGPWSWTCNGQNSGTNASCSASVQRYPITVNTNPTNAGSASCTPNPVTHGTDSSCSAIPNNGFVFDHWSQDCTGSSCTLKTVTSAKAVTAHFSPIDSNTCGSDNAQTLTKTPTNLCTTGTNGSLSGTGPWSWTCSNGSNISNCAADIPSYTITALIDPAGSGNANCSPNPINHGTSSSCSAIAESGFTFVEWLGDCIGSSCSLNSITSNKTVTAKFQASLDAACGADHGQILFAAPTKLCTSGNASQAIENNGSWAWECTVDNGGNPAICRTEKPSTKSIAIPVLTPGSLAILSALLGMLGWRIKKQRH